MTGYDPLRAFVMLGYYADAQPKHSKEKLS
jgi:hypothetical protein